MQRLELRGRNWILRCTFSPTLLHRFPLQIDALLCRPQHCSPWVRDAGIRTSLFYPVCSHTRVSYSRSRLCYRWSYLRSRERFVGSDVSIELCGCVSGGSSRCFQMLDRGIPKSFSRSYDSPRCSLIQVIASTAKPPMMFT